LPSSSQVMQVHYQEVMYTIPFASNSIGGMSYVGHDGIVKELDPKGKEEEEGESVLDAEVQAVSPSITIGGRAFSVVSGLTEKTRYANTRTAIVRSHSTATKSKSPQPDEEQPNANRKSCSWPILLACCLIIAGGVVIKEILCSEL
jgi:hypothetical protein